MSENNNPAGIPLEADEKSMPVMVYTSDALICGQIVTKQQLMAMRLLTGVSVPDYITVYQAQFIPVISGDLAQPINHAQTHLPTRLILGYHLLPPQTEPYDFDENELNRIMNPVTIKLGAFTFHAHVRISSHSSVSNYVSVVKADFIPVYDIEVIFPNTEKMPPIKTNMAILRRENIYYFE